MPYFCFCFFPERTLCIVMWLMARTTLQDIYHISRSHSRQSCEWSMVQPGHLQTFEVVRSLPLCADPCASLHSRDQWLDTACVRYCLPRPKRTMPIAFANKLCPDRIMQPHPLSDENPPWSPSWYLIRIGSDIDDVAFGSADLGIGLNSLLYVIQNLESKSETKFWGQPFSSSVSFRPLGERLPPVDPGGVSGALFGDTTTALLCSDTVTAAVVIHSPILLLCFS